MKQIHWKGITDVFPEALLSLSNLVGKNAQSGCVKDVNVYQSKFKSAFALTVSVDLLYTKLKQKFLWVSDDAFKHWMLINRAIHHVMWFLHASREGQLTASGIWIDVGSAIWRLVCSVSLRQTASTTACLRPAGSPGEVQRELFCRVIVSSAPSHGSAVSIARRDKGSEGAVPVLDPSHCYAAQSWTTISCYLITIAANLKEQKRWNIKMTQRKTAHAKSGKLVSGTSLYRWHEFGGCFFFFFFLHWQSLWCVPHEYFQNVLLPK